MSGRTFKKVEIKAWQDELTRIPHAIAEYELGIQTNQMDAQKVVGQLEQVRAVIQPMDVNISALTSQIAILDNQAQMDNLQQKIIREQTTIDKTNLELASVTAALKVANAAVEHTKFLQQIKSAQDILHTHPAQIAQLQMTAGELNRSALSENSAALSLSMSISQLQSEISNLEYAERLDRHRHEEAAAVARRRAEEHRHHHGHHRHDDHHPHQASFFDIVVAGAGAVAALGEYVADSNRTYRLSAARSAVSQQQSQYQQHQCSASSYSSQYNQITQRLSALQSVLSQNQSWLLSVPSEQQSEATHSDSNQFSSDLSRQEALQRQINVTYTKLQRSIANASVERSTSEHTILRLQKQNARLAESAGNYSSNENKDDLNQQLVQAEQLKAPHAEHERELVMNHSGFQSIISVLQGNIHRARTRHTELASNQFLVSLRDNAVQLRKDLVAGYEAAVTKFDTENPASQSDLELAAMHEMKRDVALIQNCAENTTGNDAPPSYYASSSAVEIVDHEEGRFPEHKAEDDGFPYHPERIKVYQLCGMLKTKMATIAAQEPKSGLVAELKKVSNWFLLDAEEVRAEYRCLQCPLMSHDDMLNVAISAYDAAATALRTAADNCRKDVKEWVKFAEQAKALADSIDGNRTHAQFNITFYTKMLIAANNLLEHPTVKVYQDAFNEFNQLDTLRKANNCQRGSGMVSMFLSAAFVVSTVVADKFGYLEDVPTPAKYASYGVGGSTFAAGFWGLCKGQPKGSFKQGCVFVKSAQKIPKFFGQPNQQPVIVSGTAVPSLQDLRAPLLSVVVDNNIQASAPSYP